MRATSESAEWIFLATNLGLELLSAACDQASSPRRPHYAQFGMLLAIAAVLISIWELIYRGKKERVVLRRWGMLGWFYHPPPSRHTPFGTLPDIYGLVAGISQCICCIVQYVYCLRHADNPFKASLLPAIFLVCLGASKLCNNRMNANTSSTEETSLPAIPKDAPANILFLDDQELELKLPEQQEQPKQQDQQQEPLWRRQELPEQQETKLLVQLEQKLLELDLREQQKQQEPLWQRQELELEQHELQQREQERRQLLRQRQELQELQQQRWQERQQQRQELLLPEFLRRRVKKAD